MSLLHQESGKKFDVAASGEEFTRGSSHIIWASLAAALLVILVITVYVLAEEKPPAASGEIVQVWAHPLHVDSSGLDANGAPMARESLDQVLVFAHIKLHNQSEHPLLLEDVLANVRMGSNTLSVSAGSTAQYEEVFLLYPELAALHAGTFSPHRTLAPGESLDGNMLWVFRVTREEWDARKDLNFTLRFQYQPKLTLTPRNAVIGL